MNWLIEGILRTEPQDNEFELLDRKDEQQILDGDGSKCHIVNGNGKGDLVSPSYYGMIELANQCNVKRLEITGDQLPNVAYSNVKIHNPITGWTGYGASQAQFSIVADEKAYRNAVRLSLRPIVLRQYATQWIKQWVWTQYPQLDNLELAKAMYPSDIPFDNACRLFWRLYLAKYKDWQIRYILVHKLQSGKMKVRNKPS